MKPLVLRGLACRLERTVHFDGSNQTCEQGGLMSDEGEKVSS